MIDRQVTHAHRNADGDILGICWGTPLSHTSRADAIKEIVAGTHRYFVEEEAPPVDVLARPKENPTYLTTEADSSSTNNLDNLDPCSP